MVGVSGVGMVRTVVGVELGVDVDEDAGVGGLVDAWDGDGGRGSSAGAADVELEARHVELSTTNAFGDVKSLQNHKH